MEGYGWRRKYNVWHGTMYSGYGNDCAREVLCVTGYVRPDMCIPACVHMCAHIKSFPPIPSLSIMFRGCSSFLSV